MFDVIEPFYIEDFFVLYEKFELQRRIPWDPIGRLLLNQKVHISQLLKQEKFIYAYDAEIRSVLISDPENAELFLHNLSLRVDEKASEFKFPKSVTNADVEQLFDLYIGSDHPNINYLRNIVSYRNAVSKYDISKDLQYKAKQRIESLEQEIFKTGAYVIGSSIEVSYRRQDEPRIMNMSKLDVQVSFDRDWITNNLDFPTILNNYIYLFGYVNQFFQISLTSMPSQASVMERAIFSGLATDYHIYHSFMTVNKLAEMEMYSYCKLLKDYSIELEEVVEWYYQTYLKEEYGIDNFRISLLKNHFDYYEMCKSIAPEIESIAKQYSSFVMRGNVDHEYIYVTNPSVIYNKIPSVSAKKYAYPASQEIKHIMNLLFSDQSSLSYLPRKGKGDKNLFLLIRNMMPIFDDFEEYQKPSISYLIEKGILIIDSASSSVEFADISKTIVLNTIYEYGYVNIQACPVPLAPLIDSIDKFIDEGDLYVENTLLSKQEASYFNYYLNSSEFGNSRDLRNKYAHGSAGKRGSANQDDYYSLLKILVLLTIKIENDLQLYRTTSPNTSILNTTSNQPL